MNRERITDDAENFHDMTTVTNHLDNDATIQECYLLVILSVISVDCWTVFATAANDTKFC